MVPAWAPCPIAFPVAVLTSLAVTSPHAEPVAAAGSAELEAVDAGAVEEFVEQPCAGAAGVLVVVWVGELAPHPASRRHPVSTQAVAVMVNGCLGVMRLFRQ
jgi:hypothetical protein